MTCGQICPVILNSVTIPDVGTRRRDIQVRWNMKNKRNSRNCVYAVPGAGQFGCYYTCKDALDWGWFEGNYQGPKKVTVAYDLYSANTVYLRPSDSYSDYIEASMTERSRAYKDLTIWEVWEKNNVRASTAATSKLKKRAGSVNLVKDLEDIARGSKAAQPSKPSMTKAERVKGISDNKRSERQYERQKKTEERLPVSEDTRSSKVTPLRGHQQGRKSYKLPTSLKDLLKEDQSDE